MSAMTENYTPATVRIYSRDKSGAVLTESALLAVEKDTGKVRAYGEKAREFADRERCLVVSPFKHGIINDFIAAETLIRQLLIEAGLRRNGRILSGKKHNILICVPDGCTETDKKAFMDMLYMAGAKSCGISKEPFDLVLNSPLSEGEFDIIIDVRVEDGRALLRDKLTEARDCAGRRGLGREEINQIAGEIFQ